MDQSSWIWNTFIGFSFRKLRWEVKVHFTRVLSSHKVPEGPFCGGGLAAVPPMEILKSLPCRCMAFTGIVKNTFRFRNAFLLQPLMPQFLFLNIIMTSGIKAPAA
jgi:hypothetical protein